MRNCTQETLDVTTVGISGADSGKVYRYGGLLGVAEGDANAASPYNVPLKREGKFTLTKATGYTAAAGDVAFYDLDSNKRLESFSARNATLVPVGFYVSDAASGDTTAEVIFDPDRAARLYHVERIALRLLANDIQVMTWRAPFPGKVAGIDYYTTGKPTSALGAATLTSKNTGVSDNALFSSFNLETMTENALTALTLTATAADLVFAQDGVAEFLTTSDNADLAVGDGVDIWIHYVGTASSA